MKLCKVIGTVVATIKRADLNGHRMLLVQEVGKRSGEKIVALDVVGAGVGQTVLVTSGTAARVATGNPGSSTNAAIVGIVDEGASNLGSGAG